MDLVDLLALLQQSQVSLDQSDLLAQEDLMVLVGLTVLAVSLVQ
jgi:hypothetical protein